MTSLTVATFNVCNLGVGDRDRLYRIADVLVHTLAQPHLIALQEIKAAHVGDLPTPVSAHAVYHALCTAMREVGGTPYDFCEIPPLPEQGGGHPGFNIRVGLLFDPTRLSMTTWGNPQFDTAVGIRLVDGRPTLTCNPGYLHPCHPAFAGDPSRHWLPSRRVLVCEMRFAQQTLFVMNSHLKSMRVKNRRQQDYAKKQRHGQVALIEQFAATLLACDPHAPIIVMGDMNDVPGSKTLSLLKGNGLYNVLDDVPKAQRYTRRHGGQPILIDHVLVSAVLRAGCRVVIPHLNTDGPEASRCSDHDPIAVTLTMARAVGESTRTSP